MIALGHITMTLGWPALEPMEFRRFPPPYSVSSHVVLLYIVTTWYDPWHGLPTLRSGATSSTLSVGMSSEQLG